MESSKEKKEIVKRLHYIQGQLGGIEKMINNDRPAKDVYGQLKAVEQALHPIKSKHPKEVKTK